MDTTGSSNELNNIRNSTDVVDYLINKCCFHELSYEDKLYVKELKKSKRPCSLCPDLSTSLLNIGKPNRAFNNDWYDKYNWLVGSTVLNKLFCWPCILFAIHGGETVWWKSGYSDLKNLCRALSKHNISKDHIASSCKLILFGKQNIPTVIDSAKKMEILNFNNEVRENREIIKRLIDISIFLCTQELPFRGHFKELIVLISKWDEKLRTFLSKDANSNSYFFDTSNTIQNDIIDGINFVLNKKIDEEIFKSSFISWQVDETTNINNKSQLYVILRYFNLNSGKVVERFMGFLDVSSNQNAEDLFQLLIEKFNKYDLKTKLIAQTYDGASVMSSELNELQEKIKSVAPQAIFTHCYAHVLNRILSKACSSIYDVRIFFSILSGFSAYFANSVKRTNILNEICSNGLPTKLNFSSRIIFTIHRIKDKLIQVFDFIIQSSDFDQVSIREAVSLKNSLQNYKFIFFLESFNFIFEQIDDVFSTLQNKSTDITTGRNLLQCLLSKLHQFRNIDDFFNNIYINLNIEVCAKRRKTIELLDIYQQFKQYFFEILDTIITQMEIRLSDLNKLHFLDLLNVLKFPIFAKKFPDKLLTNLLQQYNFFEADQLKNELIVVYSENILENCKTPIEMIEFVVKNDLQTFMSEFFKLLCVCVSLPITPVVDETNLSVLKRIKNYTLNTIEQNRLTNMAQIAIEREYVKHCSNSEEFSDEIIDYIFYETNRKIPLIYEEI